MKKRFFSFLCAMCMLFCIAVPVSAAPTSPHLPVSDTTELEFTTISGKDGDMTIPVVVETVPLSTCTTYSMNSGLIYEQDATYYIPATEEDVAYNESLINEARAGSPGTITESSLDKNRYITITTTIRYTLYPDFANEVDDYMIGIDWVGIDRDKNPEPIGKDGSLIGIGTPKVHILQHGYTEYPENGVDYDLVENINWGSRGLSTPTDWRPVLTSKYADSYYHCFADFTVNLIYWDSTNGAYTVTNSFFRALNK